MPVAPISKFHALPSSPAWGLLFALCLALCAIGVSAEKADRQAPMNIEADRLDHDDQKKTSVFQGKVMATKGSIVLRGDRLEVREDPQGFQHGQIQPLDGQRAYYRQKREGLIEFMEGEAERIEYDGRNDRITLTGRAELRRLRGSTLADEIRGQVIVYDNITDQFTVDGTPRATDRNASPSSGGSRVRAVLTPRNAQP